MTAFHFYDSFPANFHLINWVADSIKVVILTEDYDFSRKHQKVDLRGEIPNSEQVLAGRTITADDGAKYMADDLKWERVTWASARYAVLYHESDTLIGCLDFGESVGRTSSFTIEWPEGVVFSLG